MIKTKFSIFITMLMMSFLICIGVQAEFTDSVNTVMTVITKNGEAVESPEELKSGEYNVKLNIGNLTGGAKTIEVYVAVKADGKLHCVKKMINQQILEMLNSNRFIR